MRFHKFYLNGLPADHLRKLSTWATNLSGWSSMMKWNKSSMRTIFCLATRHNSPGKAGRSPLAESRSRNPRDRAWLPVFLFYAVGGGCPRTVTVMRFEKYSAAAVKTCQIRATVNKAMNLLVLRCFRWRRDPSTRSHRALARSSPHP